MLFNLASLERSDFFVFGVEERIVSAIHDQHEQFGEVGPGRVFGKRCEDRIVLWEREVQVESKEEFQERGVRFFKLQGKL